MSGLQRFARRRPESSTVAHSSTPFIGTWKKRLAACGAKLYVNPDGHEWKRAKWNCLIRKYWKFSEKLMVKHADLLICDSKNIESYIRRSYAKYHPATTYIAYGAAEAKKESRLTFRHFMVAI